MSQASNDDPWRARYRNIRVLDVLRVTRVTPMMQRVTLGGDEIRGIKDAPNIKLMLPPREGAPVWPLKGENGKPLLPPGQSMPISRTYSLRRLDRDSGEIDVDFVMHGEGAASTWAEHARPGDKIGVGGPMGPEVRPADWYLIAGDHTALPAISRILGQLAPDARGSVFIEVPNAGERQELSIPPSMELHWLYTDEGGDLERSVRAAPWPDGKKVYAWLAAESTTVRSLRSYVSQERGLGRGEFLAIGYWRRGMSEPEYHEKLDHDRGEDFYEAIRDELQHAHDHR
ncbi:siderophore-interacting protein [Tardiphaga sp.]|uniref:siderophore-interacting protein n=1 Tax=Tardiphaga sp. TaxID=1926292 RepID=UPI0037DA770B